MQKREKVEKGRRRAVPSIVKGLKIDFLSPVDNPAQEGAQAVMLKRDTSGESDPARPGHRRDGRKLATKRGADGKAEKGSIVLVTSEADGHAHGVRWWDDEIGGMTMSAVTVIDSAGNQVHHDHPWTMDEDGNVVIGEALGHTHEIDREDAVRALIALQKGTDSPPSQRTLPGMEGEDMAGKSSDKSTDKATKAGEKDQAAEIVELTKQSERQAAIIKLSPEHRAHFDTLEGEAADAWLAKSDDDRTADLSAAEKAANEADPVVYTTNDGIEIRKSADPTLVALAKSNDELRKRADEAEEQAEVAKLHKRADEELSFLPGTTEERAATLKAIDAMPEAQREAALKMLKAANEGARGAFTRRGGATVPAVADSPAAELHKRAEEVAEKEGISVPAAMRKFSKTKEGRELYAEARQSTHNRGGMQDE